MAVPPLEKGMVRWYDPIQLARTGIDVAVSTLFGSRGDYRLIEALGAPANAFDDASTKAVNGEFWLDYVADTGDGWNSTYAIAHALSRPTLAVKAQTAPELTQRGQILIFGGDEVYPVASREEYRYRLVAPYETALPVTQASSPQVYAIPGNHDWYDGLTAFTRLFCGRDWFAGWEAKQSRSYFAVKLPAGWWLLGTDVQLSSDLDRPQVEYFKAVAAAMQPTDRVILCNAEPHWIYAHEYSGLDPAINENNLTFLETTVLKRKVSVFLAGDLHHYRRHESPGGVQKITAGGGGAFLHPTHGSDVSNLAGNFALKASYPTPQVSRKLSFGNLLFLFKNPTFGYASGALYLMTAWSSMADLSPYGLDQWREALAAGTNAALKSPIAVTWVLALFLGIWLFTDTHSKRYRFLGGTVHGLAHLFASFLIGWGASRFAAALGLPSGSSTQLLFLGVVILAGGWVVGSAIMGLYLLVSITGFGRHSNEAFSSLGIEDWKHFLRLRIDKTGTLTIYPIGIRRVPRKWKWMGAGVVPAMEPDDPKATAPELIEAPISVR